jgi:Ca2+-binding RTX toxin-like protein
VEAASAGTDTVQSSATYTLAANVENLTLTGSAAINGTGNALNNVITGNSGANTLNGDTGTDTLVGGAGNDRLTGGNGNDTFIFNTIAESGTTATVSDVITDFVRSQDKINLSAIDAFATTGNINDTFVWKGTAAFNNANQGEVRFQKFDVAGTANDHTMVWIDNDADTGIEMAIRLTGLYDLTASDFIL